MAKILLQFDVQYTTPSLQKEMMPTASPTTQLIPLIQHKNMYQQHKKKEEYEREPSTSRYTPSTKIASTSCSLSVSCRLVKNKIKHHLEHYQQHSNMPMFSEKTQKEVIAESCFKRNTYSKVKLKSPPAPLRINHRKNNKSKCSRINAVILAVMKNMFPLYHTIANSAFVSNFCKTKPTTSRRSIKSSSTTGRTRFMLLPSLGATSFITLMTIVCLETVLLSTMSSCAKTFYMHWNTSNSIFRIDNTDHIIDVNKGNLAFEFDQVHIICPVYEPGTFENETEKYIIYNVSKVEYETCRITNADPRVIAICDKPHKLMFFTITFRPFTPQPGGLEFLPGNDYYFISTSSKDDLYRRIGGRCSTNNMKVVFKVCCAPEEKNKTMIVGGNISGNPSIESSGGNTVSSSSDNINIDVYSPTNANKQLNNNMHGNGINTISTGLIPTSGININSAINTGIQLKPINGGGGGTSINTNVDQFNRIPMQTNGINVIGGGNIPGVGLGSHGGNGIMLTPGVGIGQFPGLHGQTGIRINNVPPQHHYPTHKNNNGKDDEILHGGVHGEGTGVIEFSFGDKQLLAPNINTNHSNIVQSTINWPGWGKPIANNISQNTANSNYKTSHRPTNKKNDLHTYDKHPNEVVKNEELTYNSGGHSIHKSFNCRIPFELARNLLRNIKESWLRSFITKHLPNSSHNSKQTCNNKTLLHLSFNPIILISILLLLGAYCSNNYSLSKIRDPNIFLQSKNNSRSVTSSKTPSLTYSWIKINDPNNCVR